MRDAAMGLVVEVSTASSHCKAIGNDVRRIEDMLNQKIAS